MRIDLQLGADAAAAVHASDADSVVLVIAESSPGFVESVLRPLALAIAPSRVNAVMGRSDEAEAAVAFLEGARFTTGQAIMLAQPRARPHAPRAPTTKA